MAEPKQAARSRPMPQAAPALEHPPVPMEQIEREHADMARAAVGGSAAASRGPAPSTPPAASEASARRARRSRFQPPQELDFEFSPPERLEIRNNNIPLTVGLLFAIIASFVVFLVSMAGGSAGADPILPSFWRALGALAVLTALSFAASWFMPAPPNRRGLLDQIEAEERLTDERLGRARPTSVPAPDPELEAAREPDKGNSIDYMVADDQDDDQDDDLAGDDDEDDDEFDDDEEEDVLVATTPRAVPTEQGR